MIDNLILGFSQSLTVINLLYCIFGAIFGTLVGVIPGLGPTAAVALLLPYAFAVQDPTGALIAMAGIYYGSQYGGSTTAILLKLPGEVSSAVTTVDGYALAKKGYAGAALTVAALGSFVGGCFATFVIAGLSPEMIKIALLFTPKEYLALMFFGVICACVMTATSMLKNLMMVTFGILLCTIGTDPNTGHVRNIFGLWDLSAGIPFISVCMGLYGMGELLHALFNPRNKSPLIKQVEMFSSKTWKKIKEGFGAVCRGTMVGSVLGLIPGGGSILSAFMAYVVEKKIAKDKSKFGYGDIRGVAGPESANNAGVQTAFIPMLSLGLPFNPVMALLMAVMLTHNIIPGPSVINNHPALFWGLVTSMWIGNLVLVLLNLTTVKLMIKILKIPTWIIFIVVACSCVYGSYIIRNSVFDIFVLLLFGIIGYLFKCFRIDPAPILLGLLLGPKFEESLRQTLQLEHGNIMNLFNSTTAMIFYIFSIFLILTLGLKQNRYKVVRSQQK
jgi:putative tricarboxylic transport membrane protein